MKFSINATLANKQKSSCLIVGIYDNGDLSPSAKIIDTATQSYLKKIISQGDIKGDLGETLLLPEVPHLLSSRVLLVGLGAADKLNETNYQRMIAAAFQRLKSTKIKDVVCYLTELTIPKRDTHWLVREAILRIEECFYQFDIYKEKKSPQPNLTQISFFVSKPKELALAEQAIREAQAINSGVMLTKDLGNLPSNICTPSYLANAASKLAKEYKTLTVKVLDEKTIKKMGMGGLAAVAQGSKESGKLIVLTYKGGNKQQAPIALVGKGITFDSGGISIKPAANMEDMKYDMCGAASVLGTMKAIATLKLPINVMGIIATAENMPGGQAYKPGDILKTYSGKTVEVLNTDAEGRLVLCDALTYAQEFKPKAIVDIATLTGGVIIALGYYASGLFSNNDALTESLTTAADQSFDRVWSLPVWDDYHKALDSSFADMTNVSNDRAAHATIGAVFLQKFINNKTPWAHIDVAGTATGKNKGATGRPVPLLVQYLMNEAMN